MDYEKKYFDAIERLKQWDKEHPNGYVVSDRDKFIFPELAESEDDKIIYDAIKEVCNVEDAKTFAEHNQTVFNVAKRLLEKQGEQKPVEFKPSFRVGDMIKPKDPVLGEPRIIEGIHPKWGYDTNKGILDFEFEDNWELVEQKPVEPQQDMLSQEQYAKAVDECIYGEKKPANKVEPKFKVGDFIVNDYCMGRVIELTNDAYLLDTEQGIPFSHEHNVHLWTIKDAKDGDVLACNKEILLFKSYSVQGRISLYCWYNGQTNNFHSKEVKDTLLTTRNEICPATKEQRYLLFAKMKEAGYEWDAEKKELRKIEQKPEWSEEDEKILKSILWHVSYSVSNGKETNINCDLTDWLKSLKDRVQPQPKQEWIEEDEERYENCLKRLGTGNPSQPETINTKWFREHVCPQKQWKPSEEQLRHLSYVVDCFDVEHTKVTHDVLLKLLEQLKAL